MQQNLVHVSFFLIMLTKERVAHNFNKLLLFKDILDYLGHYVSPGNFYMAKTTFGAVKVIQCHTPVPRIRSFLGSWNLFRRLARMFSRIVATHNEHLQKGTTSKITTRPWGQRSNQIPKGKIGKSTRAFVPIPKVKNFSIPTLTKNKLVLYCFKMRPNNSKFQFETRTDVSTPQI